MILRSSWTHCRLTLFLSLILLSFCITNAKISAFQPTAVISTSINHSSGFRLRVPETCFLGKDDTGDWSNTESEESVVREKKRARVMSFLRKVGAVGANQDFSTVSFINGPCTISLSP